MSKHVYFTSEQEEWLREHYFKATSYDELTTLFNREFGAFRTKSMLQDKCTKRLGLKGMENPTTYGKKKKEQLPVGAIRKGAGATYIKVKETPGKVRYTGYAEPYWLPLQKKLYQDSFGEIASDKMVCFLDGDRDNFDLSNLYCIDRKISALLTKNHWWTNDRDLTLTAIKWCELYYAIKEVR